MNSLSWEAFFGTNEVTRAFPFLLASARIEGLSFLGATANGATAEEETNTIGIDVGMISISSSSDIVEAFRGHGIGALAKANGLLRASRGVAQTNNLREEAN